MLDQLGASAEAVELHKLTHSLSSLGVLIIGDSRSADLSEHASFLSTWVERGGVLIGFAPEGLDPIFGNSYHSTTPEPDSPFHATALMRLQKQPLTTGVLMPRFADAVIPLFGPVRKVVAHDSLSLATLLNVRGAEAPFPAITTRTVGQGQAHYFAFDVAQTMWLLHKGRPIEGDSDLDGYLRLSDAVVVGNLPLDIPYADMLLFLLQNMLHRAGVPMIHQVPPRQGDVCDFLIFFGGDDEGASEGIQVAASDFMKERGLPYHINIMPRADGTFGLSVAEHRHLLANGHEPSLHYNFIDGFNHPSPFSREDVLRQWDWYVRTFQHRPIATVNHWCRWCGWHEPAQWMSEAGGRADNSRIGVTSPPLNPVNHIGFAFGTAFPNYFYEDWQGENRKIDFLNEPIACYEVGYLGEATDFPNLHNALDLAAQFHYTMNFFYHPIYIARYPACRKAIDEILRYVGDRNLRVAFTGPDGLWEWWDARSRSAISHLDNQGNKTRFVAQCAYPEGMVVKVPTNMPRAQVVVDGKEAPFRCEEHFGFLYALVVCPHGEHEVVVIEGDG